jgi:cytochrome c oxidase accessory protein FixG
VFLDHVYRRIERWIEGDAVKRRALDQAPWSANKIFRRTVKHSLYLIVSAVITHLFLAYFVSLPEVWAMVRAAPGEHWSAFAFIAIATGILYFNFAWFREQLCIVICPYGRLQSALIDDHSLVIGYDSKRGEPRGKGRPHAGGPLASAPDFQRNGDCVDCLRCVHVCPTGIDIRQGLQMECIGCTACIDACDDVMTKLNRPKGLIRYDSQKAFSGGRTQWWRPRTLIYGALLILGATVATWALSTVKPANFGVTRMIGAPYIVDETTVRNQFLVRIINKLNTPAKFILRVESAPEGVKQTGFSGPVEVAAMGELVQPFVLQQDRRSYRGPFEFEVKIQDAGGTFHLEREVEFLGPEARLLHEEEERK